MILFLLSACGIDDPTLAQPLPPPQPPPVLTVAEPDVVEHVGVVSDVSGPTRSFVLTGEGKRVIVHLRHDGVLRLNGQPSLVQDLAAGTTLWVEGRREGDLVVAREAADRAPSKEAGAAQVPAAESQPSAESPPKQGSEGEKAAEPTEKATEPTEQAAPAGAAPSAPAGGGGAPAGGGGAPAGGGGAP